MKPCTCTHPVYMLVDGVDTCVDCAYEAYLEQQHDAHYLPCHCIGGALCANCDVA